MCNCWYQFCQTKFVFYIYVKMVLTIGMLRPIVLPTLSIAIASRCVLRSKKFVSNTVSLILLTVLNKLDSLNLSFISKIKSVYIFHIFCIL